jgi:putative ABC transport system substrate-binding protein
MMSRRGFLGALGASLLAAVPLDAGAQQALGPVRIGVLPLGSPANAYDRLLVDAFRQGLREVGLTEPRHVVLDVAWITAETDHARSVVELIQRGARLLVPCGTSASLAAKNQTTTLPILFISVGNPVGIKLVESLARPGGNVTGFGDVLADLGGKLLQFSRELNPPQVTFQYVWHPGWADGPYRLHATEQAAQLAGVKLQARSISDIGEVTDIMAGIKKAGAATFIVQPSPFTYRQRDRIIEAANRHGVGAIFAFPPAAREGALLAYGPDYADLYRRAGNAVDRILKGTKPADLPVEQPTKFELVINLKTAKMLGHTIPRSLRLQADQLIE